MQNQPSIKQQLIDEINTLLTKKIGDLIADIKSAQASKNDDTKSSAGDKFETGREMIQAEIAKNEAQLSSLQILSRTMLSIDVNSICNKVEFGSLVTTNNGKYLISLGLGEIKLNGDSYYAISLASPIGKLLKGRIIGDTVDFQTRSFTITEIV